MCGMDCGKGDMGKRWNNLVRLFSLSVVLILIVSMIDLTTNQIVVWRNSVGLWTYIIDKNRRKRIHLLMIIAAWYFISQPI